MSSQRVIVVGAGPVGLCLSLALANEGVPVTVIEALGEDNFLEQVPRAGTNHPATLEMYDRIGLYRRLEPRGIVALRQNVLLRMASSSQLQIEFTLSCVIYNRARSLRRVFSVNEEQVEA